MLRNIVKYTEILFLQVQKSWVSNTVNPKFLPKNFCESHLVLNLFLG